MGLGRPELGDQPGMGAFRLAPVGVVFGPDEFARLEDRRLEQHRVRAGRRFIEPLVESREDRGDRQLRVAP